LYGFRGRGFFGEFSHHDEKNACERLRKTTLGFQKIHLKSKVVNGQFAIQQIDG